MHAGDRSGRASWLGQSSFLSRWRSAVRDRGQQVSGGQNKVDSLLAAMFVHYMYISIYMHTCLHEQIIYILYTYIYIYIY